MKYLTGIVIIICLVGCMSKEVEENVAVVVDSSYEESSEELDLCEDFPKIDIDEVGNLIIEISKDSIEIIKID